MALQVDSAGSQPVGVVSHHQVASLTKQLANFSGVVVMIDRQPFDATTIVIARGLWLPTAGTLAVLKIVLRQVPDYGDTELTDCVRCSATVIAATQSLFVAVVIGEMATALFWRNSL